MTYYWALNYLMSKKERKNRETKNEIKEAREKEER